MPRCYPNIYRCTQCLPWHCQSVLILWHFDCSLDFFNFSLRGTKIHPKKPAFLRPIKSFIFLKYMPRLHLLPSRISGGGTPRPPAHLEGVTRLRRSGTCLWHIQSPPTSKNSPSTWEPWRYSWNIVESDIKYNLLHLPIDKMEYFQDIGRIIFLLQN